MILDWQICDKLVIIYLDILKRRMMSRELKTIQQKTTKVALICDCIAY